MPKRWSKLQQRLYKLMAPETEFQIHCALYEMNGSGWHGNKLPRYFITIGGKIVFDYPKDFDTTEKYGFNSYPWDSDVPDLSNLIEDYIQRPAEEIMEPFEQDRWGLTDILRACDRRVGARRLRQLMEQTDREEILFILKKRMEG